MDFFLRFFVKRGKFSIPNLNDENSKCHGNIIRREWEDDGVCSHTSNCCNRGSLHHIYCACFPKAGKLL